MTDKVVETAKVAASATDNYATFQGAQAIHAIADGDCFIDFNTPAVTSRSFLLKANSEAHPFEFPGGNINTVHVITSGASVNVYLVAIYN